LPTLENLIHIKINSKAVTVVDPNTGNLASTGDVDQAGWGLDQVTVDGLLGGERGPVGAAHDAGVVPVAACVESLE
jgi:hypothetical protein